MAEPQKDNDRRGQSQSRVVRVGSDELDLPAGVGVLEWMQYKEVEQNPRLRVFLGCIKLLEEVLDSNYALLNCSPERFLEIRRKVQDVAEMIRRELTPLLVNPAPVPAVDASRKTAREALELLVEGSLEDLHLLAQITPSEVSPKERRRLCVCIGTMHGFLQDTFGHFMASDPRSRHDADYFLSLRFRREVEESEWLYISVDQFCDYIKSLGLIGLRQLSALEVSLNRNRMLPVGAVWTDAAAFVDEIVEVLTPKIRQLLTLRGIRFPEMETLSQYADELPINCTLLRSTYEAGRDAVELVKSTGGQSQVEREQRVLDLIACHEAHCRRLVRLSIKIGKAFDDLRLFVPIWLAELEKRRALMLHLPEESRQ